MERGPSGFTRLDHVTLVGSHEEVQELGFEVTPTGPDRGHARVFLDRAYLELIPPDGDARGLRTRGWFLRPENLGEAADRLRAAGIPAGEPNPYAGVDGSWLDVEIGEVADTTMPLLTRRTDLPETEWPPPAATHANGMTRLAGLRIRVADPGPVRRALSALGLGAAEGVDPDGSDGIVEVRFADPDGNELKIRTSPADRRP